MGPDSDLRAAYEAAAYEVHFPGRTLSFRVGEPLPGAAGPFAIITAWNPGHGRPSQVENDAANRSLEADVTAGNWRYFPSLSYEVPAERGPDARYPEMPGELRHAEPGFAILGIELEVALALARKYRQAAILWCDGRRSEICWAIE